jgi:hypothetical protein
VTSYGKEDFIEASKRNSIPVVELQHGVISPYHPAYSFPGKGSTKLTFPDYLLMFGDYWANCVDYPIPTDRIQSVGYPFIETEITKLAEAEKKQQVVVVSQQRLGEYISKFALELSEQENLQYEIVLKLHPLECDDWQEKYPWLKNSKIRIIDDKKTTLYGLFAESKAQIGAFSTAIYEGLAFGLQTLLLDIPGVEHMNPLLDSGAVVKIESVDQAMNFLSKMESAEPLNMQQYFERGSLRRIIKFIDSMVSDN